MKKIVEYTVGEVKNKIFKPNSFEDRDGEHNVLKRDKTITITFKFDDGTKKEVDYGFVNPEEIYEKISKGKDINLNLCYIKDFSFTDCKAKYGKNCKIKSMDAIISFWDCTKKVDFQNANFGDGNVSFSKVKANKLIFTDESTIKTQVVANQ